MLCIHSLISWQPPGGGITPRQPQRGSVKWHTGFSDQLWLGGLLATSSYCCLVAEPCLTLCNPMHCSPPDSSLHGILQGGILEWVAISFFRGIFLTQGSKLCLLLGRRILYHWATSEAQPPLSIPQKEPEKKWYPPRCTGPWAGMRGLA